MIKQVLPLCGLLLCAGSNAQYDTLWISPPETSSYDLTNTPFPTADALAARTQYLVRGEVLEQIGLLSSDDVAGICFQVVDDDQTDPACLVDLHVQMKNEVTVSLTDFINTGLNATATSGSVNLQSGVLGIIFNTNSWQWVGPGLNAIVEVNWERGADPGLAPRIVLDTGLTYTATYTGRTGLAVAGSSVTSLYPADVQVGSDNSLPAMGLLIESMSIGIPSPTSIPVQVFPNPATVELNVRLPWSAGEVRVLDVSGRSVLRPTFTTKGTVDVSGLPSGCFVLLATGASGTATARFIKE